MKGARVGPRGPENARVMCVGEAPGVNEEATGQPFTGAAGKLLEECLMACGIDPSLVFFTNICKYRPPGNEIRSWFGHTGMPNATVAEGILELSAEIERVKPTLIIPLGNYPLAILTGKARWSKQNGYTGIGDYRGSVLEGRAGIAGGIKCLPTYHPASILREYSNKPIFKLDLRRANVQSQFSDIRRPRKHLVLDPRGADREAWIAWLTGPEGAASPPFRFPGEQDLSTVPAQSFLSADIEYPGNKLSCCGFTRHSDVAITLATLNKRDIEEVGHILLSGVPLCWQNGMFDAAILSWHYDIDCYKYIKHDTMIGMHIAYTEFPKNLNFIGSVFTDQPFWEFNWKRFKTGVEAPQDVLKEMYEYNAIDTWVTHESMVKMLEDELVDPKFRAAYDREMSYIYPLWKISRKGVRIDTEKLEFLKATLGDEAEAMMAGLQLMNGGKPLNVRSNPQVTSFVYSTLGVPQVGKRTEKGWAMDDKTLADLLLKSKTDTQKLGIRFIRDTRERLNLISKFCEIELDDDGRMRCHYDPAKTQTGRLASRKFYPTNRGANLQNIPTDNRVRSVFVADPGFVFGYADLKSAESLVVAHLSNDPEMLRLHSAEFMSGGLDGHKYVAAFLFNKVIEEITKEERYIGKRVRHACNYMLGWLTLMKYINADAATTGVSITAAEAKMYVNKYRQLHPMLVQWWGEIEAELFAQGGLLWSCHDRPHQFYGRQEQILPNAVAFKPQSTVADTLNMGLLRVDADEELSRMDFQMFLQVHDAIGFQIPKAHVAEAVPRLQSLMTIDVPIRRRGEEPYMIQIPVDIKIGNNWGEFDHKKPEENPGGLRDWQEWRKAA